MENTPLSVAILDMYEGTRNIGMHNILEIVNEFSHYLEYEVFDVRGEIKVPDLSFDIYLFSGGPGNPLVGDEQWLRPFHNLIDELWKYNQYSEAGKKYCFFICHSFQMACHHFGIGRITRRRRKSFGTFPVYKTEDGKKEWLFKALDDPFWVADFREYQVTNPDFQRMDEIGAKLLAIEKERSKKELQRAMMAVRFSAEMVGTQFHPEADPNGMRGYFSEKERVVAIMEEFGKEKLEFMMKDLNHPDKIEKTHRIVLPFFLHRAIQGVRQSKRQPLRV
ncbi:MAG TPA: GMP synthase [Bacteroidetes bacterium]|nr:GMP synthase [Bacteroidota bacterium]